MAQVKSDLRQLKELLDQATKRSYADYARGDFQVEKEQVELGQKLEKEILESFLTKVQNNSGYIHGTVSEEKLKWAREQLFGGKVAGVDGRRDKPLDIVSGVFCEIGIARVTYQTLSDPNLSCFPITSHLKEATTVDKYYSNLEDNRLKEDTITTAMIYWELEACLNSPTAWVLKDGPIIHPSLVWKGYDFLIDLLRKVVNHKRIIGIVKDLRGEVSIPLRRFGKLLKPGEYLVVYKGVKDWITDDKLQDAAKRLRLDEGSKVYRGVFKARVKAYGFEIHEESFEEGMAILMADAMNNKRGMPNLVDQADTIAGIAFPSGLFSEKIKREFLLRGMGEYWDLIDEHDLRG